MGQVRDQFTTMARAPFADLDMNVGVGFNISAVGPYGRRIEFDWHKLPSLNDQGASRAFSQPTETYIRDHNPAPVKSNEKALSLAVVPRTKKARTKKPRPRRQIRLAWRLVPLTFSKSTAFRIVVLIGRFSSQKIIELSSRRASWLFSCAKAISASSLVSNEM